MNVLRYIQSKLIVSCQPVVGGVLDNEKSILSLAEASINGGASALRVNEEINVSNIKKRFDIPVIGIKKRILRNCDVIITPFCEDIESLVDAGADIIAFDATFRKRPVEIRTLIEVIQENKCIAMADCSNALEAFNASELGADIVATTLSGYTKNYTPKYPDFGMISKFKKSKYKTPIIAEGRIHTPKQAAEAMKRGAYAVVVGTAINRIEIITDWFVKEVSR